MPDLKALLQKVPKAKIMPWMAIGDPEGLIIKVESQKALEFLTAARNDPRWGYLRQSGPKSSLAQTPKTVVIFGPSGSGKDTVIEVIQQELAESVVHLPSDLYYGPTGKLFGDSQPGIYSNNYDHPNSVDWDLQRLHLSLLRQGHTVTLPEYDFSIHSRVDRGRPELAPKSIIVVSGIMAAHALKDEADLLIGVDAPWEICVARRINRDVQERGRTKKDSQDQIASTTKPGYLQFVKPYLDALRRGTLADKAILFDNSLQVEAPQDFPARKNKHVYLEAIKKLV